MKLVLLLLLNFSINHTWAGEVTTFDTDYCTNYPEGTPSRPGVWKHCCLLHDLFFWAGGTKDDRDASDLELRSCVEKTGEKKQAAIIYFGVRAGSYSPIKYPKRQWGNAWTGREKNAPLTQSEVRSIEEELNSGYEFIGTEYKTHFIDTLYSRSSRNF